MSDMVLSPPERDASQQRMQQIYRHLADIAVDTARATTKVHRDLIDELDQLKDRMRLDRNLRDRSN